MAIDIIGCQKIPSGAKFFDQHLGNRVRLHRCRFAHAKDIPAALAARDFVSVAAGHDLQLAFLGSHPRHRERHRGVDVAGDEIDLVFVDELPSLFNSGHDVISRVRNEQLRLTAKNAAAVIDLFDGEPSAGDLRFSKPRKDPGERLDHPDFYRRRLASPNWKRRRNRARGACQAGFENGAAANSTCVRRSCSSCFWIQVGGS